MPRTNPPCPLQFRIEAIKLARSSDKPLSEVARDLGIVTDPLPAIDSLMAAQAENKDMVLVSANAKDFKRESQARRRASDSTRKS